MSEIIHRSSRGTVEVFEENSEKCIRRTVNAELPLYETLKNSECKYLPRIYSVDIAEGKTVITEEFITGKNLLAANLDEKQVVHIMIQLCAALEFIHGLRIVHRDIKPSNILLSEDDSIRLIDFEAARFVRDGKDKDTRYLGTDGFAPPEQYGFSQTDPRADIYAAGQTMKTLLGSLSAKRKYAKIIRKCTALDPAERYQSAKEFADALTNKREKIVSAAVFAAAVIVLIFAAIVPKEAPAENIPDNTGIVAEAEANTTETTSVSATEFTTEAKTVSKTEASATEETTAETEITSETAITDETETDTETVATNKEGLPLDWLYEHNKDEFFMAFYGDLTCYGKPENVPDYNYDELLLIPPEHVETKILFVSMKELIEERGEFYMYFDMNSDGVNEAFLTTLDENGEPYIQLVYGVPSNGGYHYCWGLTNSEYIKDYKIDENCFVQVTCFKNVSVVGDDGYVTVTVGDGKNFNITELYSIVDYAMKYRGSCWGETKAVMDGHMLSEYFADNYCNNYMLGVGDIWVLYEYDYEKYRKIKDSGDADKLREMFEQTVKIPWWEEG